MVRELPVREGRAARPAEIDDELFYPASDGKPMGETGPHVIDLLQTMTCLRTHFAHDPNVYVGANMFIYYVPGDRRRSVCPDLFVVRGVPKQEDRRVYLTWVEGKTPDFILELLSRKTEQKDRGPKKRFYQTRFRTQEYFLFDPETGILNGYRLVSGRYREIKPDDRGRIVSEVLGLMFGTGVSGWLRVYRLDGTVLKTPEELAEENAALAAEIDRLRAMVAQLQGPARA
jgi:Uma2 family endonuclease